MTSADSQPEATEEEVPTVDETAGVEAADNTTVPDAEAGEVSEEQVTDDLDALLNRAMAERDEYLDMAKRARADFENFRKRSAREIGEAEARGSLGLAKRLLPALDNLERAQAAAVDGQAQGQGSADALAEGVGLVLRQLHEALGQAGIEAYDPTGESFDPVWHEALSTIPGTGSEPGLVIETVTRGYRAGEVVVRAAQVVVSG